MIHSRIGRGLMLGTGALAAGAIALGVATTATAAETSTDDPSTTAATAPADAGNRAARPGPGGAGPDGAGPAADAPYVGARLVPTKDGATVARVIDGSPADAAGLNEGDVVVSIDSVALDHKGALREALADAKAGDEITVVVDHNGSQETVVITLGDAADRPAPPAPADVPWVGARLVHVEGKDGVLVRSVAADGPADAAGLAKGDVITSVDGTSVTDWWKAREVIAAHAPGDKVEVVVNRDGASKTLTVTLGSLDDAVVRSNATGDQTAVDGRQGAPGGQGEPGGQGHGPRGESPADPTDA